MATVALLLHAALPAAATPTAASHRHRRLQPGGPTHGTAVEAMCDSAGMPLATQAGTVFRTETAAAQRAAVDCGRLIHAPDGSSVQLTFSAIDLGEPPSGATLTVYDGVDDTAPPVAVFSGSQIPPIARSTGQDMYLRLQRAGPAQAAQTFFADWTIIDSTREICDPQMVVIERHGTIEGGHADLMRQVNRHGSGTVLNCAITLHAPTLSNIMLTFSELNLGGCATITAYDGWDSTAPVLARFSTASPSAHDPSPATATASSSGQDMHLQFTTVPGPPPPGCSPADAWRFAADWDFLGEGFDICSPPAAVLMGHVGVLHDDAPDGDVDCSDGTCADWTAMGAAGYSDNMDCGVRIHADQPG